MAKIHTHYDNLKVARNAPPEVIRAAYRTLSQRFHPDRNAGDDSATHIFQLISAAYEALSDPAKRREHDEWIAKAEAEAQAEIADEAVQRATRPVAGAPLEEDFQTGLFARFAARQHERVGHSMSLAFKGLTARQRNFILLFSGTVIGLLLFIVLG